VVNEAFVEIFFPNEEPLGQHVRSSALPPPDARADADGALTWDGAPPWLTIVGVVSNTPARALAEPDPTPALYMPLSIAGGPDVPMAAMHGPGVSALTYVVRTAAEPWSVLPLMREAVATVDPHLALAQVRTLQDVLDAGSAQMAFTMVLITIAAGVALLLGLVGIYGVIAYAVSRRTNEIGVRLALGAEPGGVVALIVRQGARVAVAGVWLGLAIALAGSRLIESLLYGVNPRDPAIFAGTALALLAAALLACWIPARRAARIDPTVALRAE
jgi:predicted lysophospholipase L1 biosynthesis ABC-type transport system permease subunit